MPKYIAGSSDGSLLQFEDRDMYEQYKADEQALLLKYYKKIRERYGIWASNQGKFVATLEELNDWDSKTMENLFAKRNENAN